jgi:hypothetical protein
MSGMLSELWALASRTTGNIGSAPIPARNMPSLPRKERGNKSDSARGGGIQILQ